MPFQYGTSADSPTRQILNKVPEVTIFFWIIKILATTVGETGADFLNSNLGLGMTKTSFIMAGLLCLALVFQFRCKKYVPAVYWVAVVLISVVGTLLTDNLVEHLGMTLPIATILFASLLAVTFATWYAVEKTLSIHSIHSMRREAFYWLAILFTFALGTAGGDLTAEGLHLGYWISALLFAGLIAATTFAYSIFELNAVVAFWIAYILTRPLGASLGDFMSQPRALGGLNLGTMGTSAIFVAVILALVVYLTRSHRDQPTMGKS